ncbi:Uncharacterised protein [Segatella copri]|nr:Uncharacterised protein [Segatella copri]
MLRFLMRREVIISITTAAPMQTIRALVKRERKLMM